MSDALIAQLRARLRAHSGADAIHHEGWVVEHFVPAGLVGQLLAAGVFMDITKRRLAPPVHAACHRKAHELALAGVGDWWLGLHAVFLLSGCGMEVAITTERADQSVFSP